MTISRYIVHHFDLSTEPKGLTELSGPAHYCVFWYMSVPLGECYLQTRGAVTSERFWGECLKAITPALAKYSLAVGKKFSAERLNLDYPSIRSTCDQVLQRLHPNGVGGACDLSVVICTRNRAEHLRRCLSHLQDQFSRPAEIIVVDNAPENDDTHRVSVEFGVRYIREDRPGLDVARNTGARAARASLVAYTDDDTQPHRYWTHRICETFGDPGVAAMTGLVLAASLDTEAEVIFEKFWPFNRGYLEKNYDEEFFNRSLDAGPPVWEIGAGANMAFRKSVFREIGYFDERLDVGAAGCSGDSELWYRALACGLKIVYNPMAVVCHRHRDSVAGLRKQLYAYMRGFTVAILIQYQRFGHRGNLRHLINVLPPYYLSLVKKGFPYYPFQYKTVFSELRGIVSGLFYYLKHRNTDPKIFSNDAV